MAFPGATRVSPEAATMSDPRLQSLPDAGRRIGVPGEARTVTALLLIAWTLRVIAAFCGR
jgi:hypothetical protein